MGLSPPPRTGTCLFVPLAACDGQTCAENLPLTCTAAGCSVSVYLLSLSGCLSICLSVCLSVCLVCLSVCGVHNCPHSLSCARTGPANLDDYLFVAKHATSFLEAILNCATKWDTRSHTHTAQDTQYTVHSTQCTEAILNCATKWVSHTRMQQHSLTHIQHRTHSTQSTAQCTIHNTHHLHLHALDGYFAQFSARHAPRIAACWRAGRFVSTRTPATHTIPFCSLCFLRFF